MRHVGRRLPIGHGIAIAHRTEDRVSAQVLSDIRRRQCCRTGAILQHRIPLGGSSYPLRPRHHLPQPFLNPLLDVNQASLGTAGCRGFQCRSEIRDVLPQSTHTTFVVPEQESRSREKVLVVVLSLDLRVSRIELVRRRGQQQHPDPPTLRSLGVEQRLRQLCRRVGFRGLQQRPEALKLVQDNEVRFQCANAGLCQNGAESADHLFPPSMRFLRPVLSVAREIGLDEFVEFNIQSRAGVRLQETFLDVRVQRSRCP